MTDRHVMTPEEAKQLPMPEGTTLEFPPCFHQWMWCGDDPTGIASVAVTVANGQLPREVLDHAWAAHRGEEWQPESTPWGSKSEWLQALETAQIETRAAVTSEFAILAGARDGESAEDAVERIRRAANESTQSGDWEEITRWLEAYEWRTVFARKDATALSEDGRRLCVGTTDKCAAWVREQGLEGRVRNPRLRITELEQQLGYERAKRSQAEGYAEAYDSRLARIRVALTKAGLPEVERYPDEDVSEEERQLRAGGRVIDDARRIEILADALKSAREQLADWPKERRDAAVELARLVRRRDTFGMSAEAAAKLCDAVDPTPLPAIAPCPRCGARCIIMGAVPQYAECLNCDCLWRGPHGETVREAIEAHNREAALLTGGGK